MWLRFLGGLGTCFTISHPIGCYHRYNYRNNKYLQLNPIVLHNLIYICSWPIPHLSSVGHVLNRSRQESFLHVKHDITYQSGRDRTSGHSSHCRAIVPLIPSSLEGLIWGSTAGSIVIQCADGEKHGLFRSCCLFPASCNKMPQNYFLCIFPSWWITSRPDRGKVGKIEACLTMVKGRWTRWSRVFSDIKTAAWRVYCKLEALMGFRCRVDQSPFGTSEWTQEVRCVWL